MKFLHPQILWFLLLAPALVAAYVALLRRKKKHVIRYASVGLVKEAIGPAQRFRRHIPPLLFLLAQIALIIACADPTAVVTLPTEHKTIVLAMDVSLSMGARDVDPNRITAAQTAAKSFVQDRPPDVNIGIVAFGGTAALVQPPTRNREDLLAAIERFQLQRGTATGSALYVALQTLFPDADIDLEQLVFKGGLSRGGERGKALDKAPKTEKKVFKPVAPGSYTSGVIVLLSDGRRTTGPDPLDAARMAADRGVRVYTVGFGTEQGGAIGYEGWSVYVRLDEETLKQVAEVTRGEYFYAGTSEDLKKVYQRLTTQFVLEKKDTEIAFLWAGLATLLLTASLVLSLIWFSRL
ncbi:MAG TPA: VWA domain-containing protein [Casimicrobiaceae bacterium]|jgi:Ca-activated chloride channel family protein